MIGDGTPGPGRTKGVPNKITADIKAMIIGALEAKGGQRYLEEQADKNPVAFMGLVAKVLPMTMAGDPNNPLFPSRIEIALVKPKG
jgi:hypothetical protein